MTSNRYKLRGKIVTDKGVAADGISYAALSMLDGDGQNIDQLNTAQLSAKLAEYTQQIAAANNLSLFKIVETIEVKHQFPDGHTGPAHRFTIQPVDSRTHQPTGEAKPLTGWGAAPEGTTGRNGKTTYDCDYFEYRHANGSPLRQGEELVAPQNHQFGKQYTMMPKRCAECLPPSPPADLYDIQPTSVTETTRVEIDLSSRAKLPAYVDQGTIDSSKQYTLMNTPMLLGVMPGQPHVAAQGRNPNSPDPQNLGDYLSLFGNAVPKALYFAPWGHPLAVSLFQTGTPDRAGDTQSERQGSNNLYASQHTAPDRIIEATNQWPLTGKVNPFSPSDAGVYDATLLPGMGVNLSGTGSIIGAEGTHYENNYSYTSHGGVPCITLSQKYVESGGQEHNEYSWGTPSAPVPLYGTNNYGMAAMVDQLSITPQLHAAAKAYKAALDDNNLNAAKEAAQHSIDLLNYRSTLVGISNYRVQADVSHPLSEEAVEKLNPAERIAYMRSMLIAEAAKKGIKDLNALNLPEASPIRSIPKAQMREQLVTYYTTLAEQKPGAFRTYYEDKEHVGASLSADLDNADQRRAAAEKFVESMSFYQNYPDNGVELKSVDRFVSTRDPNHPTDLSKNNFNAFERGEMRPEKGVSVNQGADTAAMSVIAGDPELTRILLQRAGSNSKLAEAFATRDRRYMDTPAEFGDHSWTWRSTAREEVKKRGYYEDVMARTFSKGQGQGILRGEADMFSRLQQNLAASAEDPNIVTLRQADLKSLATDGSKKIKGFEVGSLQSQLLYALRPEDLQALETSIKARNADNPDKANADIQALRAGILYARDQESKRYLGGTVSHTELLAHDTARQVEAIAAQDLPLRNETREQRSILFNEENAKQVMGRIAKYPAAASAMFAADAANGQAATHKAILAAVSDLDSADKRVAVTKAIMSHVDRMQAVRVIGSNLPAFMDASSSLKNLNATQATTILQALQSSPEASKLAVAALSQDPKASAMVADSLASTGKADTLKALFTEVTTSQADIATKAKMKPDIFSRLQGENITITDYTVKTGNIPQVTEAFVAAVSAQAPGAGQGKTAALVKEYFANPATSNRAIDTLREKHPDYAKALTFEVLKNDPTLMASTLASLRTMGDPDILQRNLKLATYPQGALANALEAYAAAKTDSEKTAAAERLNTLMSAAPGTPEAAAVQDLTTALLANPQGRTAVSTLVGKTVTGDISALSQPLTTSTYDTPHTLAVLYSVLAADPANAAKLATDTQTILANMPTVPGFVVPGIIVPLPKAHPGNTQPDQPLRNGGVGNCADCAAAPIPAPVPGAVPVAPIITHTPAPIPEGPVGICTLPTILLPGVNPGLCP